MKLSEDHLKAIEDQARADFSRDAQIRRREILAVLTRGDRLAYIAALIASPDPATVLDDLKIIEQAALESFQDTRIQGAKR